MTLFCVARMHVAPPEAHGEHASLGQSEYCAMASLHVIPVTLSQGGAQHLNTRSTSISIYHCSRRCYRCRLFVIIYPMSQIPNCYMLAAVVYSLD